MRKIELPFKVSRPILACGADLKGAFALAKGRAAFIEEGFGDLSDPDNFARYEKSIRNCVKRPGLRPAVVACDLHPGYFSSRFAESLQLKAYNLKLYKIQHHEAHVAAAITEHSLKGDVIGVAFDGTGFGLDGNVWGGEFFVGGLKALKRAAHLEYVPMPGGEAAIRHPWRMVSSWLYRAMGRGFLRLKIDFMRNVDRESWPVLKRMIDKGINSPLTSSMGRLFDAAASLVLAKGRSEKEAELPIELERIASGRPAGVYDFGVSKNNGVLTIGASSIIKGIVKDLAAGEDKGVISGRFHNTIADIITKVSMRLSKKFKVRKVVLTGGVFQNALLSEKACAALAKKGFDVYAHSKIACGDPGIPVGQIAIANARGGLCA